MTGQLNARIIDLAAERGELRASISALDSLTRGGEDNSAFNVMTPTPNAMRWMYG